MTMQPAAHITIRCKHPRCPERGRVVIETDGASRIPVAGGGYIDVSVLVRCPACGTMIKWIPADVVVPEGVSA